MRDTDIIWESKSDDGTSIDRDADRPAIAGILHDVRAYAYRYVVLSDEQAIAVTLWTVHTHAIDAADTTPYLSITSATKRAGKTRLLEVLDPLVRRPWLTGRTSAAALVRKIDVDSPTLLLDESDAAFNGDKDYAEAFRGILKSGYKRSGKASLCIGKGADLSVRDFSTFSAKAIAGIGKLPDTVADRAIPIVLKRRMVTEPISRWHDREGRADAAPLYQRVKTWSDTAIDTLRAARPALRLQLSDRAADVWEPLLAIADLVGGDWPSRARRAAVMLMGSVEDTDPTIELLTDIAAEVLTTDDETIPTKDIIEKLVALEHRPWATWRRDKPISPRGLARLLDPLGVHPIRLEHVRGYRREALDAVISRYLPVQASLRQPTNETGSKSGRTCDLADAPQNASATAFEADSIGPLTHSHIDPGDDSDEHF
jgi:Protein of unknown function (DUF3631)